MTKTEFIDQQWSSDEFKEAMVNMPKPEVQISRYKDNIYVKTIFTKRFHVNYFKTILEKKNAEKQ